jgi:hypothetical protein
MEEQTFIVEINWNVIRLGLGRLKIKQNEASLLWLGGRSVLSPESLVARGPMEWHSKPKLLRALTWPLGRGRLLLSPPIFTDPNFVDALEQAGFEIVGRTD